MLIVFRLNYYIVTVKSIEENYGIYVMLDLTYVEVIEHCAPGESDLLGMEAPSFTGQEKTSVLRSRGACDIRSGTCRRIRQFTGLEVKQAIMQIRHSWWQHHHQLLRCIRTL
ncbi:hypothetical protein CHS0354_003267 [Potamilus streckersoni]|uniref:Uncharacterized protein n=1 Tax=Potamilus streckersoni TaxID=2493646 RepID=A0AAE0SVB9_9BIVA|nr:hypothetical protein CHS0354_003267 [Potamilus streckersoni]